MQWGDVVSNNYFIVVWKMYSCILPSIDVQQMNSLWKNLQTTNNVKLILFVSRFGRQFTINSLKTNVYFYTIIIFKIKLNELCKSIVKM